MEELSKVCSQIVLKCWNLARVGRPDILWSVNKLARSITKWTKSCDKRLSRLSSYNSSYMWIQTVLSCGKHCPSSGTLCIFGSHTFVPISWMCKKQTSVSHSSTESEIISLDAGLRFDGIPALDLWDLIVAVLHGNTYQNNQARGDPSKSPTRKKIRGKIDDLDKVDFAPSNVNSSRQEALLHVFEDNEAVIKMIIKGRSPTMRHDSRTHRSAFDWLFDRINLDPKNPNQIHWHQEPTRRHIDKRRTSHVMNGIIFSVCSTSAISVPPIVLTWCWKERKKMQVKKESQQNRSRWWFWSPDAAWGILTCLPPLHQKARKKPGMKVKYLWARGLSSSQVRWDL